MLSLPTCVGLRYGHLHDSLRGFSRQCEISPFVPNGTPRHSSGLTAVRICLDSPPRSLDRDNQRPAVPILLRAPSVKRHESGTGILTCSPSPTPSGLGLGPTNPGRINLPQETLGFRRTGFSPAFTLLVLTSSLPHPPALLTVRLHRAAERSPTAPITPKDDQNP